MSTDYIFLMSSPDRAGILAAVAESIAGCGGDIRDAASFGDADSGEFFIRIHLAAQASMPEKALRQALAAMAARFDGRWQLVDATRRPRVAIAVSKFDHCLSDLLNRVRNGSLAIDVPFVVSNHEDAKVLADWHGIEFHHLPVTRETRAHQELKMRELFASHAIDLVVLARYMQILSPKLSAELSGRCINIHHSFLPSFKGAMPYKQAHERGVKLIGATAHYVTDALDEGPIIEQDVRRVTHATSADEMASLGREIESSVLARAVRWHTEHRVLFNGSKTVVFS
ncbi:MAG: formyltetrahydrofolate deformylase [Pseudomonadota bacterium]